MANSNSDEAYHEDWCLHAFQDLAFSYWLNSKRNVLITFGKYQAYFCHQALEKFLKSSLAKKYNYKSNNDLKGHNHNLRSMTGKVFVGGVDESLVQDFLENLNNEADRYLNRYKRDSLIAQPSGRPFILYETEYDGLGCYFDLIESCFLETRYPKGERNMSGANHGIDTKTIWWNIELFITTVRLCKLIVSILDSTSAEELVYMNFTWSYQQFYVDSRDSEMISIFELQENLYNYLFSEASSLSIDRHNTIEDFK